ncbi:MAG: cysteine desulfurase [Lachnospiraceae bacterium]|nr:cysteine desulfurase [Lachnospiraceae bacterium]
MRDFREDFPIFRGNSTIYFDSAATAQRPAAVHEAMRAFNDTVNANPLRGLYDWSVRATEAYEEARSTAARFIGAARPEEVIFTRNTTESLNLVAYTWGEENVGEGDEIAVTILEHHSNLLPWQMLAKRKGAKLVFLECLPDGTVTEEEIRSKLTDRTKLVAVGQVSNVLGVENPVQSIAAAAHEKGAVVVVDGAQSAPHRPVDVSELGADFFAFSGHKLMGPMGIGVLWGRMELLEKMPPFLTGGEMIEQVTRDSAVWAEVPHKFEAGTVNASGAVGLKAAIEYIGEIGFGVIMEKERTLTRLLIGEMQRIPEVRIYGPEDPQAHNGIVSFNIEGCHPHDVASVLDSEGICVRAGHHCAQPLLAHLGVSSTARASLYFYNTEEEVLRFAEALRKVRRWLGYGT